MPAVGGEVNHSDLWRERLAGGLAVLVMGLDFALNIFSSPVSGCNWKWDSIATDSGAQFQGGTCNANRTLG
jgi:hypothetical protein